MGRMSTTANLRSERAFTAVKSRTSARDSASVGRLEPERVCREPAAAPTTRHRTSVNVLLAQRADRARGRWPSLVSTRVRIQVDRSGWLATLARPTEPSAAGRSTTSARPGAAGTERSSCFGPHAVTSVAKTVTTTPAHCALVITARREWRGSFPARQRWPQAFQDVWSRERALRSARIHTLLHRARS